jgi:hypothetical protein
MVGNVKFLGNERGKNSFICPLLNMASVNGLQAEALINAINNKAFYFLMPHMKGVEIHESALEDIDFGTIKTLNDVSVTQLYSYNDMATPGRLGASGLLCGVLVKTADNKFTHAIILRDTDNDVNYNQCNLLLESFGRTTSLAGLVTDVGDETRPGVIVINRGLLDIVSANVRQSAQKMEAQECPQCPVCPKAKEFEKDEYTYKEQPKKVATAKFQSNKNKFTATEALKEIQNINAEPKKYAVIANNKDTNKQPTSNRPRQKRIRCENSGVTVSNHSYDDEGWLGCYGIPGIMCWVNNGTCKDVD